MSRKEKKFVNETNRSQLQPVIFASGEESIGALKKNQLISFDEFESYKKLKKKRVKKAIARMFIWIAVLLFIPVLVFMMSVIINPNVGHNFFGYTFYIVSSESMKPVFDKDDCIVVKNIKSSSEISLGDDITFIRENDGKTVTHRVIDIIEHDDGRIEYITRGVHNYVADNGSVAFENVIGVRVATLSALGHLVVFFRTSYGIITFTVVFAFIMFLIYLGFRLSDDIRAISNK